MPGQRRLGTEAAERQQRRRDGVERERPSVARTADRIRDDAPSQTSEREQRQGHRLVRRVRRDPRGRQARCARAVAHPHIAIAAHARPPASATTTSRSRRSRTLTMAPSGITPTQTSGDDRRTRKELAFRLAHLAVHPHSAINGERRARHADVRAEAQDLVERSAADRTTHGCASSRSISGRQRDERSMRTAISDAGQPTACRRVATNQSIHSASRTEKNSR